MTEPRDDDIKRLLDRAIGQEPALSLNRAEIFRAGRRKVRNRRLAASGGVAASVVAVVVGAATLTNLVGGTSGNEVTPAIGSSSTSQTAPPVPTTPETPGLSLPLTTTTSPPVVPPGVEPEKHAAALTAELAASDPIPKGIKAYPVGDQTKPPLAFVFDRGTYLAGADLADFRGAGKLEIEIGYIREPNTRISCEASTEQVSVSCTFSEDSGRQMTKTTRRSKTGEMQYIVRVFRPDGTDILAIADNFSMREPKTKPTSASSPLVEYPILEKIAINPRLTYG